MLPYTISRISSWEVKLSETKPWMLNILCGECVYIYIYKYILIWIQLCSFHGRCRAPACFVVFLFFCCVFLFLFDDGVGSGGMVTFIFMLRWWCYLDHGVGWGGMLTFMFMLHWWRYVDHRVGCGGVGWGGMLTLMFMLRWWCCVDHGVGWNVNVHVHVMLMTLHWSWGEVGWGGMLTFMFCYTDDVTLIMGWGWVGWGGVFHVHVTLMMLR